MKIGQLDNTTKAGASAAPARTAADAKPAVAPEASAKVELSPAASMLASQGSSADFDAEKVARIAQAIRDGKFEVNAEAIADKLIAHTRDLLTPRSH
jgi:negative regulator of flagellin synthesis FlgM